jgi:feruloyl-CoA synthase
MRGKALHIDAGAPLPGRFEKTLENLADVGPTEFSSVPAAYPLLLQALEQNETFARRFFSRVRMCSFGGAALSPSLVARLQAVSIRVCGERIAFGGGYGMTEACGLLALVYWRTDRTDLLGLPPPGVEMKLIRIDGDRWECRVRGENIFAGYGDTARAEVFDDEGFFITGDAVQFAEPGEPDEGLLFAGRIKEDFKLANGTWVRAGGLREALLDKLRPLASDLIVVGENREELAALVWSPHRDEASLQALWQLCREFNAQRPGATQRIARLSLCERPADPAAGELTAKGTINVRKLLDNRRELVEQVYSSDRYRV